MKTKNCTLTWTAYMQHGIETNSQIPCELAKHFFDYLPKTRIDASFQETSSFFSPALTTSYRGLSPEEAKCLTKCKAQLTLSQQTPCIKTCQVVHKLFMTSISSLL